MATASISSVDNVNCRRYEDKVVLITAATKGIGLAMCERFAAEGAKLAISSRKSEHIEEAKNHLVKECKFKEEDILAIPCDVGNSKDRKKFVEAAVSKFGRIDVLVSHAGVNPIVGTVTEYTKKHFDLMLRINIKASFELTRLVVPYMKRNGGGSIVFTSTISAQRMSPGLGVYGTTKAPLHSLTLALSQELAPFKIRVNTVAPGIIYTDMSRVLWDKNHKWHDRSGNSGKDGQSVWGTFGHPHQVASVMAYICSDDASFVTGEVHSVNGGIDCRL
ncbi:unnamed protein product [Bursaphelenchus xylophilus]|uniref:(pine wood nematode) hypothetical protein n=1 Tax=Bursaphelenchus xylophilus TaxID=6326 RepID=A0A1I7SAS1_BURXY|nr:unnamed protein product [Bursaphelenchus xylophilus]CAG9126837.1 unnamed protein product [Bursaphelenchus xylophilus]